MRLMVLVKATEDSENGVLPSTKDLEDMGAFNEELVKAGVMLDGDGLRPSEDGVRISYPDGEGPSITDGPFAETKDLIAGWMVIDVDSYDRAVELAGELSAAPGKGGTPIHEWLELRPFMTTADLIHD